MKAGERNRRKIFVILNKLCCFCCTYNMYNVICTYNMYNIFSFSTLLLLDSL